MTSPVCRPDRPNPGVGDPSARRGGRGSAVVIGTIVLATIGLIAMVGWPSLWWDVATNANPPRPLPGRRGSIPPTVRIPPQVLALSTPEWRTEPPAKAPAEARSPVVRAARRSMAGSRRTANGLTVTEVRVAGAVPVLPMPPPHIGLYSGACWAPDGESFFVSSANGELFQVTCPDLMQTRVADLGTICRQLTRTAAGLVLTLSTLQELWVLDPDTLAIRRRVGVAGLRRVLTGPDLDVAYGLLISPDRGAGPPTRINLTDGTQTPLTMPTTAGGFDFRRATTTPDGRTIFAEAVPGRLVRYQVEGDRLLPIDETEPIVRGDRGMICVSPDGRWVCLPAWDGHANVDGELFVYSTGNLTRPAFNLRVGTGCHVLAFDPVGRRICGTNFENPLLLFDDRGKPGPVVPRELFSEGSHIVEALIPHPDGRQMLVLTTETVYLVEFTGRS
jgi:hypothetical protein